MTLKRTGLFLLLTLACAMADRSVNGVHYKLLDRDKDIKNCQTDQFSSHSNGKACKILINQGQTSTTNHFMTRDLNASMEFTFLKAQYIAAIFVHGDENSPGKENFKIGEVTKEGQHGFLMVNPPIQTDKIVMTFSEPKHKLMVITSVKIWAWKEFKKESQPPYLLDWVTSKATCSENNALSDYDNCKTLFTRYMDTNKLSGWKMKSGQRSGWVQFDFDRVLYISKVALSNLMGAESKNKDLSIYLNGQLRREFTFADKEGASREFIFKPAVEAKTLKVVIHSSYSNNIQGLAYVNVWHWGGKEIIRQKTTMIQLFDLSQATCTDSSHMSHEWTCINAIRPTSKDWAVKGKILEGNEPWLRLTFPKGKAILVAKLELRNRAHAIVPGKMQNKQLRLTFDGNTVEDVMMVARDDAVGTLDFGATPIRSASIKIKIMSYHTQQNNGLSSIKVWEFLEKCDMTESNPFAINEEPPVSGTSFVYLASHLQGGLFGPYEQCPGTNWVQSFSLENRDKDYSDKRGALAIGLTCSGQGNKMMSSSIVGGASVNMTKSFSCNSGFDAVAFVSRTKNMNDGYGTDTDERGLTYLNMRCQKTKKWGFLGGVEGCHKVRSQKCQPGKLICGLQTRLLPFRGNVEDEFGLIDVKFKCCPPTKVDGGWSEWDQGGTCSTSCGTGKRTFRRTCSNPTPSISGKPCDQSKSTKQELCNAQLCPIDGGWSSWDSYGACSVTCGQGYKIRRRHCTNPAPQHGGQACLASAATQSTTCASGNNCPIDGSWGTWQSWSGCSATCNRGTMSRSRKCDNPAPQFGGKSCSGSSTDTADCTVRKCYCYKKHTIIISMDNVGSAKVGSAAECQQKCQSMESCNSWSVANGTPTMLFTHMTSRNGNGHNCIFWPNNFHTASLQAWSQAHTGPKICTA